MSNSSLVSHTRLSPNRTAPRNHAIDTITIHCVVGHLSLQTMGHMFADPTKQWSSNYGVDDDGRVGMFVEEKNRSWCSSSSSNDNRAITIEVACDLTHPYAVRDKAMKGLIALVADICKRNDIQKLLWENNKALIGQVNRQNITLHRWFRNKECPGKFLVDKMPTIVKEVNSILQNGNPTEQPTLTPVTSPPTVSMSPVEYKVQKGDTLIAIAKQFGTTVEALSSLNNIKNPNNINIGQILIIRKSSVSSTTKTPYMVKVTVKALNVRSGPGMEYRDVVTVIRDQGTYTIIEEKNGWGKLKSGVGWIYLMYTKKS